MLQVSSKRVSSGSDEPGFIGFAREIKCFEFLAWLTFKRWMRACQSGFLFSSKETFPPTEALLFSDAIFSKNAYMLQAFSKFWLKNWSTWTSDSTFQSCILCNFEQGGPDPFYHNVQSEYQLGVPLLHQQSSSMMALLWIGRGTWSVASWSNKKVLVLWNCKYCPLSVTTSLCDDRPCGVKCFLK